MDWQKFLAVSSAVLGIVNGLMLLRFYLRDRPSLTVRPVHPDVYQWFFLLPDSVHEGKTTKRYGFLVYVGVGNRGLRDVSLDSWRLKVKTVERRWIELRPISMAEPHIELGKSGMVKVYRVFGQTGGSFEGHTMVRSGDTISGFAYYMCEVYDDHKRSFPLLANGKAYGKMVVHSVFGNKATTNIVFTQITLEKARQMVEGIDQVTQ
jgi:hypothetical protein